MHQARGQQKEFSAIASSIPVQPGIYKYFDSANELLYVGKAKHLRKRVSSYFSKTFTTNKTQELVKRINHIEFTIVNSEQDAFLLENTLIKEFQPKYNISLKDSKTYPYIVIKKEPFPRVFFTRRKINDGSQYLGPYTSVVKVKELLDFIRENILLRTCKLNLTENNIKKGKFKVCLEYHLGNCKGPCEGLQTAENYNEELQQLVNLLKGNLGTVIQHFKKEMQQYIQILEFEKAAIYQKKVEHLQSYQSRSTVVNTKIGAVDVFSIVEDGNTAYVNYLAVNAGAIVQTKTILLEKKLEETAAALNRRHHRRLPLKLDAIADRHLAAAAGVDLSVDLDFAALNRHFGLPAGVDPAKDFQELVEGEFLGGVGFGVV